MEVIGRYTVGLVLCLLIYIAGRLAHDYATGDTVIVSASYWFGFVVGTMNLLIWKGVLK